MTDIGPMNESCFINRYRERIHGATNLHFELYPTTLRMHGTRSEQPLDVSVRLAQLDPMPDKYWLKNHVQIYATRLTIFSLGAMIFSYFWGSGFPTTFYLCITLFVSSMIYFFVSTKNRIEYSYFKYHNRSEFALAIAKAGDQSSEFDAFIESIIAQIKTTHASHLFETTDPGSPE